VSVVGRHELVAMLTLVRNTGAVMVRTENAEGRMELDTALRDSTALPAPSATSCKARVPA